MYSWSCSGTGNPISCSAKKEQTPTITLTNIQVTLADNTTEIRFTAPENVQAKTEYSTDTSYSTQGPHETSLNYVTHVQILKNLLPDTTYNYRITVTNQALEIGIHTGSFTTTGGTTTPVCGNNTTEAGEQCDDGNTTNGDGCSSTCQTEGTTGNSMTFNQIESAGLSNACYPDTDHYVAEFLYQNPDAYFWEVEGSKVTKVNTPQAPANAIKLPKPSGGDDTSALECVINGNPWKSFVVTGGGRIA